MNYLTVTLLMMVVQGPPVGLDNVPFAVAGCVSSQPDLVVSRRLNPFYVRGDFDGDGLPDHAVLVEQTGSHKQGVAFCLSSKPRAPLVVGAGTSVALEGGIRADDLGDFDLWAVRRIPSAKMDELYMAQAEAGSGTFRYVGGRMVWHQGGI